MFEWGSIQSKNEMEFVLDCILKEIKNRKAIKIFGLGNEIAQANSSGVIGCTIDDELYIQFDNGKNLVINFTQQSDAFIEYRELTQEENERYEITEKPDLFNCHHEIHTWEKDQNGHPTIPSKEPFEIYDINLKYDLIIDYEIHGFNHSYDKWVSNGNTSYMITIPEGGDYFDRIDLIMKNGARICIYAEDAIFDGCANVWIEDKNNNLTYSKTTREKNENEV